MEDREILELIQQTNRLNNWVPKKIFLQFNEAQFKALLKGHRISWDMRYSIHLVDGYFYNHRSGFVVNKFKIEKIGNNLFQVTEMYDNPEKSDYLVVFDSLREACRQNDIELDREHLASMCGRTMELNDKQKN